jgi:hypothetical protein
MYMIITSSQLVVTDSGVGRITPGLEGVLGTCYYAIMYNLINDTP